MGSRAYATDNPTAAIPNLVNVLNMLLASMKEKAVTSRG